MARPPSNASSVYSRSPDTPRPLSSTATPAPRGDLPQITPLDHQIFVAGRTTMALETTKTHLSTAKSVAQSPLDPITEKHGQRDQQAHENEFYRTCCANFCHLATAVVDITKACIGRTLPFRPIRTDQCTLVPRDIRSLGSLGRIKGGGGQGGTHLDAGIGYADSFGAIFRVDLGNRRREGQGGRDLGIGILKIFSEA